MCHEQPVGGFAAIDGAGAAVGGTFRADPRMMGRSPQMSSCIAELQVLRIGLRRYRDGTDVEAVIDSKPVLRLLNIAMNADGFNPRQSWHPAAERELRRHVRRLGTITVRMDHAAGGATATDPLMVAAHRLALTSMHVGRDGADFAAEAEWLAAFAAQPHRGPRQIQRQARQRSASRLHPCESYGS
ncbi:MULTISPECIES: hypothetical protein [unclassified Spirillospora]|uniref:hypothetical protein n=1 Tax=unclassified Spirillospora TaxID=2642701 RepID=UPI00371F5ED2